jgi:lysophospholipase L1-like esterase
LSEAEGATYLDIFEKQREYLEKVNRGEGKDCSDSTKMAFRSLSMHYLLFQSLDTISKKNGFVLLTDGIHLNSTGAKFIADEIEKYLLQL